MRLRTWLAMILLVAVSVTFGCTRAPLVPLRIESVNTPSHQYTAYGASSFVVVYVLDRATGLIVPISVPRQSQDLPPLDKAVALLNGELATPDYRFLGASHSRIQGIALKDTVAILDMSAFFQAWVTRNLAEERAFVKAAVLTFTSFEDISAVKFTVNGSSLHGVVGPFQLSQPLHRPTVVNSVLSPAGALVLYVRVRGSELLVPWSVQSEYTEPSGALNELIRFRGHERLVSPVPINLSMQSVRVEDGIATVNLDKTSVSLLLQGALDERLVLDALVYTLLEFPEVKQVRFLVDGRVLGPLGSHVDLSRPLGRTPINMLPAP